MTVIAIDGPAGSGKSTVARALAERLGVPHVDTGAYYRAATLAALRAGVDVSDGPQLGVLTGRIAIRRAGDRTYLDGEDVEAAIRTADVDAAVSAVAAHPQVRAELQVRQRAALSTRGGVVEGRDAGTGVVPGAHLKIWLTADARTRAVRRAVDGARGGVEPDEATVDELARALEQRDARDAANMARAVDVREIDTTGLDVDAAVDRILALVTPDAEP